MSLFLDRIDSVPITNVDLDAQLKQWMVVLVDVLNENIFDIQNAFNFLLSTNYTAAEIAAMDAAGKLGNGILIYDSTNNVYVGKQSGTLVKFATSAYP